MIYLIYDGNYSDAPLLTVLDVPPEAKFWELLSSWNEKIRTEGPPGRYGPEWKAYWAALDAAGYAGDDALSTFVSMLIKDHGCRKVEFEEARVD